jgi:hypothetical protein
VPRISPSHPEAAASGIDVTGLTRAAARGNIVEMAARERARLAQSRLVKDPELAYWLGNRLVSR